MEGVVRGFGHRERGGGVVTGETYWSSNHLRGRKKKRVGKV